MAEKSQSIKEKELLDALASNPDHELSGQVMEKLGVTGDDVQMWALAKENPDHELSSKVRNKVILKVADAKPVSEDQAVSDVQRFIAKNLLDGDPSLVGPFLKKQGFDVRVRQGESSIQTFGAGGIIPETTVEKKAPNTIEVRNPDTNQWGPIDPSKIDLAEAWSDITDIAGDVAEAGVIAGSAGLGAAATGPAAPAGAFAAASAAGAGTEALKQKIAKSIGARKDISLTDVARNALFSGVSTLVPGSKTVTKQVPLLGVRRMPFVPSKVPVPFQPAAGAAKLGTEIFEPQGNISESALQRRARSK